MQKRIPHLDVFKGILIIMVVMGHIVYMVGNATGTELTTSPYYWTQYIASVWMAPYYMAAFFLASGYCSSFNRSLKEQLCSDAKRLVIPAITVPIIMRIVTPPMDDINIGMFSFIWKGRLPWFLLAMFFARLVYKLTLLVKCKNLHRTLVLALLSVGACWILRNKPNWEVLDVFHALAFVIFVDIGHILREKEIKWWWVIPSIVLYCLLVVVYSDNMPALCEGIYFSAKQWPIYFAAVISGTMIVYQISKWIDHNRMLEYLGRNSLVIYLTHCAFLKFSASYLSRLIIDNADSFMVSLCVVLFMLIGGTAWGAAWAWLLNRKYSKWFIGEFGPQK